MKALGLKLLAEISSLFQLGLITYQERVYFAKLVMSAMSTGYDQYYKTLKERLTENRKSVVAKIREGQMDEAYADAYVPAFALLNQLNH